RERVGRTARGVIDYKDPDAWIGHHDIAMNWPESSALTARVRAGNLFAGGFQRLSGWSDE
ncbi:hypothetical protein QN219_33340, partial [Sinorhizobium sp. 7-81]|nr:hypothetical protein [Sinorhizobium sp. 8-89]